VSRYGANYLHDNEKYYAAIKKGRVTECEFWADRGFVKEKLELNEKVNSTNDSNSDF
jgi:hypothetical protein